MRGRMGLSAAAALMLWGGLALADDRDTIVASCGQNLNLPPDGCDCIADKALSEFNENEFAFVMAVISGDQGAQASAQAALTVDEQTHVATRMTAMPAECAGG